MLLDLPQELLIQINQFLPIYNILQFSRTCRRVQISYLNMKKTYYRMILRGRGFFKFPTNMVDIVREIYLYDVFNNTKCLGIANQNTAIGNLFKLNEKYTQLNYDNPTLVDKMFDAYMACGIGHLSVLKHIYTPVINCEDLLIIAVKNNHSDIVKYIASYCTDITHITIAFVYSASNGHFEIVRHLLSYNIASHDINIALMCAIISKHRKIAHLLLSVGAVNINIEAAIHYSIQLTINYY
jgi:hypothetical protein